MYQDSTASSGPPESLVHFGNQTGPPRTPFGDQKRMGWGSTFGRQRGVHFGCHKWRTGGLILVSKSGPPSPLLATKTGSTKASHPCTVTESLNLSCFRPPHIGRPMDMKIERKYYRAAACMVCTFVVAILLVSYLGYV